MHTLPFLLQESTQEQTRTSSLVPVTALGRILQPVEQQRSEKTSVLWLSPCMHGDVEVVLGTPFHTHPPLPSPRVNTRTDKDKQPCACHSLRQNPAACRAATLREDKCALAFTMHA